MEPSFSDWVVLQNLDCVEIAISCNHLGNRIKMLLNSGKR